MKNKHADDWSPLLQILKRHKAAWANDCSKLEEDNMFKRDNKLDNTPSDDKPKSFSDRINEIKAALKSYTELEILWHIKPAIDHDLIDDSRRSNVSYAPRSPKVKLRQWLPI